MNPIFSSIFVFVFFWSSSWANEVTSLPGLNEDLNFKHYSGYLRASDTRFLHYWLTESERSPNADPFIIWFNGGPGCSSLGGLLSEQGPFHIKEDGKNVYRNKYAWNKEANVMFLEAPAGVGFSYSTDPSDVSTGDEKTAVETYEALKDFFVKFPHYRKLDLYITGESYAGVYVPTLVSKIIDGQNNFPLNLKGMAVGNGIVNVNMNADSIMQFAYAHGLIDQRLWETLQTSCCRGCADSCAFHAANSTFCQYNVEKVMLLTMTDMGLNVYDLYRDCYHPQSTALDSARYRADIRGLAPKTVVSLLQEGSILHKVKLQQDAEKSTDDTNDGVPICLNGTAYTTYLRLPEVRRALHIPDNVDIWKDCSDKISLTYRKEVGDVTSNVKQAVKSNVRVLLYYGDTDMMCNFLMGQNFAEALKLPLVQAKQSWKYKDQIAGFVTRYKGLDFLTVKGAGHMVPEWKAPESLKMITQFINNRDY